MREEKNEKKKNIEYKKLIKLRIDRSGGCGAS